jgi:alcohol dehydrogenase, propanol-preferring
VGGDLCYIGRAGGMVPVSPGRLPFESAVMITTWGTIPELREVVALARSGAIRTEVERFPLEEAVGAYRKLARGEIRGRAVVIPGATDEALQLEAAV